MEDFLDIVKDAFADGVSITGMVILLMMIIEFINKMSLSKITNKLSRNSLLQVLLAAALGSIPGCFGGIIVVSLYTHGLVSFGALVAMMIASMGDEAFFMLAISPYYTFWITLITLVIGVVIGIVTNRLIPVKALYNNSCNTSFVLHDEDFAHSHHHSHNHKGDKSDLMKRIGCIVTLLLFTAFFIYRFCSYEAEDVEGSEFFKRPSLDVLEERWLNLVFAIISGTIAIASFFISDHTVDEHLWKHAIREHLLSIFLWTTGTLLVIQIALSFFNIESWISSNAILMIVLAAVVGIIPESGPHLIFITLFIRGSVPFSVLLASSISQDGHASLPLLASNKRDFAKAKLLNVAVAIVVGLLSLLVEHYIGNGML